jgi:hypothetical protein
LYNFIYNYKGSIIILSKKNTLEQFRDFYKEYNPKNFEEAVEKFAIFGGVSWGAIDTSKSNLELIESLILPDFRYIRNDVTDLTTGMPLYHSILTGIAMGDGKTHTAFKRANTSQEIGMNAINELCDTGIIKLQKGSKHFTSWKENETVSNKLFFASPFLRFWFAFVSPIFKGIREGDYKELRERFANRESEFIQLPFVELSHELLKLNFVDDKIVEIGTYWDNEIELDIYAKTKSGKIIVGVCKYTNSKLKKSELTKLQELCAKSNIKVDTFVLVSKSGFSNELKSLKGEKLRLISLKNFKKLID